MLTKGAIGNLVNRYRAVLQKCNLINTFGSLAVASMLVLGGAAVAGAATYDKTGFTALGSQIDVKEDIKVEGASLAGVQSIKTSGKFEWFGEINDTAELKTDITAKDITYSGHVGNQKARSISGKLSADTLTIFAEKDSTGAIQKGLSILNDAVLDGVGAIRIEAKNSGLACLTIGAGVSDSFAGDVTLAHDGSSDGARIEIEEGASIEFSKLIAESGSSKIQVNHSAAAKLNRVDVKDSAYFALDVWTSKDDQTATFELSEINVGDEGQFRAAIYNDKKPTVEISGDMTINLGKNGIVDLGGERNADWDSENIKINSNQIQVNVKDINSDSHVYLSKEGTDLNKTSITVSAGGENNSGDVNADFEKMAGIVQLTSNTDELDADGKNIPAEKTGATGATLKLAENDLFGASTATVAEDGTVDKSSIKTKRNTLMDAALKQASVTTVALDKILTNDVRKRLGDIRSDKNTTGVWMRWDGGKLQGNGLSNEFNTIQIGGDTKVGKNCRLGVAGTFTHGDAEFARGNAELEGFTFATYATWMGENGMFADVVARLGQFSNEMKVEGRTGDMDNRVFSLSGEYGWRLPVCDQFFVEPQVELAYTYVSSDNLQLGDTEYQFDNVNSLTGRAGVVFGWNLPDERGNVYARASVLQQFMGDAKISGTNGSATNVQKIDGDDTWFEYGIGANIKLTDKTYIWADVERTEGAELDEEWRGTVGIRYSF